MVEKANKGKGINEEQEKPTGTTEAVAGSEKHLQ